MNNKKVMNNTIIKIKRFKPGKMNQKGVALAMVLILSLIALIIISVMLFLLTQGTRISGFYKRYATAREAGIGGTEIVSNLIKNSGNLVISDFIDYPKQCNCGDPYIPGDNVFKDGSSIPPDDPYYCLCAKLCDNTADWPSKCSSTMEPADSPDMKFDLTGIDTEYEVASKIVSTTIGNTDLSGEDLGGSCVACSGGTLNISLSPYLYRIEVNSESAGKKERSRLSILYAH